MIFTSRHSLVSQENNEQNEQNNNGSNNNNFSSTFIFNSNSPLPGAYPGNQQNSGQQNRQDDNEHVDHELD